MQPKLDKDEQHWRKYWWAEGLGWALIMFLIMGVLVPLAEDKDLDAHRLWVSAGVWLIGGLVYGLLVRALRNYLSRRAKGKDPKPKM